ncbi:MAG: DUF2141 domain-containing protein [Saprospiraceae bacterium]|nr:DUF2141 domain-containing protein [Saprospiraceae bacterium]
MTSALLHTYRKKINTIQSYKYIRTTSLIFLNKYHLFYALFLPVLFLSFIKPEGGNGILTVNVTGIDTEGGSIRVAIFNSQDKFLDKNGFVYRQVAPVGNNKSVKVSFNIPHATYAVTCYHDINDNHILDQNYMGIPQEPYAMSNNVNIKWRRPTFDETKFVFSKPTQTINFELKRWKDR